ncbi:hypothetical protein DEMA109039_06975 [Deinococcus marmoris]
MHDLRAVFADQGRDLAGHAGVPDGLGSGLKTGSLLNQVIADGKGLHVVAVAAQQRRLGPEDHVLAARLLIEIMDHQYLHDPSDFLCLYFKASP